MFRASYKIATVFGIPVRLHISALLLVFFYLINFSFPDGLIMGIGILASIALHELGHSLVAIAKKCRVREITLWFLGGVAQMESMPRKPFDEFLMAIAGPAVSMILGGSLVFIGGYLRLSLVPELAIDGLRLNIIEALGWGNIVLAIFNLIPAFPMDGGRILRAGMTPFVGRLKATRIAANIGKIAALCFVFIAFRYHAYRLIILAIFLYYVANKEYRAVLAQERGRNYGFWDWVSMAAGQRQPTKEESIDDDQVVISPPPYKKGPASHSRISEDHQDSFGNS